MVFAVASVLEFIFFFFFVQICFYFFVVFFYILFTLVHATLHVIDLEIFKYFFVVVFVLLNLLWLLFSVFFYSCGILIAEYPTRQKCQVTANIKEKRLTVK